MSKRTVVKHLLLNATSIGISIAAALFLGETAVRIVARQQLIIPRPDIYVAADSLGWRHRPLVNTTVNTGERTVTFRTDSSGFRVARFGRRPTTRRVLLVGDSFMAAMQVEYEQSLAGILDDSLSKLSEPASIDNSGVAGWNPPQYLVQLRRSLDAYAYDAVVVCTYIGNDVVTTTRPYIPALQPTEIHPFRWPRSLSRRAVVDAWLYPINDVLKQRSHLYILLKKQLRALRMRAGLTAESLPSELLRRNATAGRWDTTAKIFQEMAAAARSRNVPIRFVLIPSSYQVDKAELRTFLDGFNIDLTEIDPDQPNRLLRVRLAASGIDFVDALDQLRAASTSGLTPYGSVDAHLSPEGHKVLAAVVLPPLLEMLSADPALPRS